MRLKISPEYLALQRDLHARETYGKAGYHLAATVREAIIHLGSKSISDYGAGRCGLKAGLDELGVSGVSYFPFDPAFPEYGEAKQADLVCCLDVLEHIEPDCLDAVLDDLKRITVKCGLFTIATGPAEKYLVDGRNAHLIQQPMNWWLPKLQARFRVIQTGPQLTGFYVVVATL